MSKALPFKTQPRQTTRLVGDPAIGELEFPVHGSLLWFEREAVRQADGGFNLFRETAKVALPIAQAEGMSHLDAHAMVTRILGASLGAGTILTPEELELRAKYGPALGELNDQVVAWNDRRQVAAVTALISNRLPGCQDWTEEDTRAEVTELMMAAIYQFFSEEESGQQPDATPQDQEAKLAEDLGKSQPEPGDPSPSLTGSGSTGDSEPSTPELPSLGPSDSEPTPSASSSAPLKRGSSKNVSASTAMNSPSPS